MAVKPSQLLKANILKRDAECLADLRRSDNVDKDLFAKFAKDIAVAAGLPAETPFALKNRGDPDMGIFDFTKKHFRTEPCRILGSKSTRPLLVSLVGDSLIVPFWPLGTGANKAVLAAMDSGHYMTLFKQECEKPAGDSRNDAFLYTLAEGRRILKGLKGCRINGVAGGSNLIFENKVACSRRSQRNGFGRRAEVPEYTWLTDPHIRYANLGAKVDIQLLRDCLIEKFACSIGDGSDFLKVGEEHLGERESEEEEMKIKQATNLS